MKENLKKQLLILLLLVFMASLIILSVFLIVIDIFWLLKILVFIVAVLLSVCIFISIKKLNKQLVYIEKEVIDEPIIKPVNNKIRCPKCYNPYDGDICFVCGYTNAANKKQNNG